jgi:hypothetical protein
MYLLTSCILERGKKKKKKKKRKEKKKRKKIMPSCSSSTFGCIPLLQIRFMCHLQIPDTQALIGGFHDFPVTFWCFPALSWRLGRISGRYVVFNSGLSCFPQLLWYFLPTFEFTGDISGDLWRYPTRSSRTGNFPAGSGGLRRVGWRRLLLFGSAWFGSSLSYIRRAEINK